MVEIAATLPGDAVIPFLRANLVEDRHLVVRVRAAEALLARGQTDVVPVMIKAWQSERPRLLAKDHADAYFEVGYLISFLARSGRADAIEALARDLRKAPVDARLAVVKVFLPWPKSASHSANGSTVTASNDPNDRLPPLDEDAARAVERLLVAELDDTEQRRQMDGFFNEAAYKDPRVCDMAALTMAQLWPVKYQFEWSVKTATRDAQIVKLRASSRVAR